MAEFTLPKNSKVKRILSLKNFHSYNLGRDEFDSVGEKCTSVERNRVKTVDNADVMTVTNSS